MNFWNFGMEIDEGKVDERDDSMEVPVESHGTVIFSVRINVDQVEGHQILEKKWYKLKGQPVSRGIGNLFDHVSKLRKPGENLFPGLVPIWKKDRIVAFADVDEEDVDDLKRHVWILSSQGYAQFYNKILGIYVSMHRYIMNFPEGLVVDHVGWNRLDNRKSMLRICTQAENARNGSNGYLFGKRQIFLSTHPNVRWDREWKL